MNKRKKVFAALALAGMVLSTAPIQVFATTTASAGSSRLAGLTRIETAIAIADAGWSSAETAVIAPSEDEHLVDALAAAPLAGQENAPILLTEGNKLNDQTKTELVKLNVKKAYVVGAIDQAVVADLNGSGISATAIKGSDRVDTATQIAAKLTNTQGSFVVGYGALPDALSVASYAAANKYSILIADPAGRLPQAETAYAKAPAYLLGGPTLVADGAVAGAVRIAGLDRFETNDKVMAQFADSLQYEKVYVANGEDGHLVDSLVASSLAGQTKSPILLGTTKEVKAAARVGEKMTDASQTIALGGTSVVPDAVRDSVAYKAPAVLAVESVTAINQAQLAVVFNQKVDVASAQDYDNYTVRDDGTELTVLNNVTATGSDGTVQDVLDGPLLQADGKTVIVTVFPAFANPTTASITIAGVKDLRGNALSETTIDNIAVADTTLPTVKQVEVLGPDRIKVSFSEPVSAKENIANYTIDDGNYVISGYDWVNNESAIELITGTDLSEGKHQIEINSGSANPIKDYAGYELLKRTVDFTIVADNTPIQASVKSATQTEVVVKFNKPVKVDNARSLVIYHSSTGYSIDPVADIDEDVTRWNDEWTLDFTNHPLPGGTISVYIDQDEDNDPIVDAWGHQVTDDKLKISANVEEDVTPPTVTNVSVTDEVGYHEFTVTYSEDVAGATSATNYTLKNADGDEMTLSSFTYDSDTYEVTFRAQEDGGLLSGGNYTLTVENVTDVSPAVNEMAKYTKALNVADVINPTVESVVYSKAADQILVQFSEAMATTGSASVTDLNNYVVSFDGGTSFIELDSSDTITVSDDKTYVTLDLSNGTKPTDADWDQFQIRVSGVEDTAGNLLDGLAATVTNAAADKAPGILKVEAIAKDEITVTFDTLLDDVSATGVKLVTAGGTDSGIGLSTVSRVTNDADYPVDVTEVTYRLGDDLNTDASYANLGNLYVTIDGATTGLTSVLGTPAEAQKSDVTLVTDGVVPELDTSVVSTDGTKITLTFTEPLTYFANNGKNGFSVTGDGVYDHSTISSDGKVVILHADPDYLFSTSSKVSYSSASAGLADQSINHNELADFSNITVDELGVAGTASVTTQGVTAVTAVPQVETLTVTGTVTTAGDAEVTITAAGLTGSPLAVSVPVTLNGTADAIATAIRAALTGNTAVNGFFTIGGTGADVVLTAKTAAVNDTTMNIALANGTAAGITEVTTSTDTTAGVAGVAGVTEVATLVVTAGAAVDGSAAVTVNGVTTYVPLAAGDTTAEVATKIANAVTVAGYNVTASSANVVFTATAPGDQSDLVITLAN